MKHLLYEAEILLADPAEEAGLPTAALRSELRRLGTATSLSLSIFVKLGDGNGSGSGEYPGSYYDGSSQSDPLYGAGTGDGYGDGGAHGFLKNDGYGDGDSALKNGCGHGNGNGYVYDD